MAEEVASDSLPEKHEGKHSDRLKREHFLQQDSDHIDLDLLLQAVLDISDKLNEQDGRRRDDSSVVDDGNTSLASRSSLKSRGRHVTIDQASLPRPQERKNMSFSNFRVNDIDRENQRLLRQITSRHSPSAKSTRTSVSVSRHQSGNKHVSHSEINRLRFQRKVDAENEAFLHRLQAVKPTHALTKADLTKSHSNQQKYSKNASKFRPTVRRSRPSSASSIKSHGSGVSLAGDNASEASFASSKISRASSASNRSSRRRTVHPVWEAGW